MNLILTRSPSPKMLLKLSSWPQPDAARGGRGRGMNLILTRSPSPNLWRGAWGVRLIF